MKFLHSKLSSGLNQQPWSCKTAILSAVTLSLPPNCNADIIDNVLTSEILASHCSDIVHPFGYITNVLFPFYLTGAEGVQQAGGDLELLSVQLPAGQRDCPSPTISTVEGDSDSFSDVF